MANRTLMVKGKITKLYLDQRHGTGKSLAVISYPDPCVADKASLKLPDRKMVVPGAGYEIGQEVTIKVETEMVQ